MAQVAIGNIASRLGVKSKFWSDVAVMCVMATALLGLWALFRPLTFSDAAVMARADGIAAENAALNAPPNVIVQATRGEICSANEKGEFYFTQDVRFSPGRHHYIILPRAGQPEFRLANTIASVNIVNRRDGELTAKNGGEDISDVLKRDGTYKFYPVNEANRRAGDIPPFFVTVMVVKDEDDMIYSTVVWSYPLTPIEREEQVE